MQPFNFKVVPSGDDSAQVPVAVAGQTMVDVQRLLTDIGTQMIRRELRLQGDVPEALVRRFSLSMDLSEGRDVGAVTEGEDTLMLDALNQLIRELDMAASTRDPEEPSNHLEFLGRRTVARDVLALCDHLEGYDFYFGTGEGMRRLRIGRRAAMEEVADDRGTMFPGALIGIISQDPVRKHRWVISCGDAEVPVTFASNIAASDIPIFARSGPLIASGTVVVDDSGRVTELRSAMGCYSFPSVKFHRIITASEDIALLNPVEAVPGYNQKKGAWTLDCEALGISVSKPGWDQCVVAFHEYFAFLWDTYAGEDGDFEGEELEIRELLLSMMPVTVD